MTPESPRHRPLASYILGPLVSLLGVVFVIGGGQLAALGGSVYYLFAGLWLIATGGVLFWRYGIGLAAYVLFLIATAIWSFWEVGASIWLHLPRLGGPLVVFVLLILGGLFTPGGKQFRSGAVVAVTGGLALLLVVGAASLVRGGLAAHAQTQPSVSGGGGLSEWTAYGAGPRGQRYSPAAQINPQNVRDLQVAWTYRTGERPNPATPGRYRFEATPLYVKDTLYFCTPYNRIIALDAETGHERWVYDPQIDGKARENFPACRGVSYWAAPDPTTTPVCPRRILATTLDATLLALDASTGRPCPDFGAHGEVNLRRGLGEAKPDHYYHTSPPAIGHDVAVVGGKVFDGYSIDMPSGVVRGFDVRTGRLLWNWDPGRPNDTAPIPEGEVYTRSSPNSWAPASVDEELGLVFLPMGNGAVDHWGGTRNAVNERFSSSVVALDLLTGKLRWVYQTVHHDLWDLDVPAQPTLVDLRLGGKVVPALFAPTKQGDIFVLDRRTGAPIVPVREKPVPQGAAPGDWTARTQPFSDLSFAPARLREADMWGVSPLDQLWCRIQFRRARYEGAYTAPRLEPTVHHPGNNGVFSWGGAAVDEGRSIAFLNAIYVPFYHELVPRSPATLAESTARPQHGTPYVLLGGPFLSPLGVPCSAPPWGEVMAVDLATMKPLWRRPFGTTRDRTVFGISLPLGMPNMGGPILTGGGVAFIAGSADRYIRAYEPRTGRELWRSRLPAGGQATPMTYFSPASGRQFVVIAAGGHSAIGTKRGDYVIAYSLPGRAR